MIAIEGKRVLQFRLPTPLPRLAALRQAAKRGPRVLPRPSPCPYRLRSNIVGPV
ncbi:MAG TPA: hypothetical protein VFU49_24210 [Ktedonobacteraceae bacterium]|nr:hypothetical protein [Ktedonobacteraceae bacterium]